jgi:alpha-L-fucosidase
MTQLNLLRRCFLKIGTVLVIAFFMAPQYLFGKQMQTPQENQLPDVFQQFQCPQWLKDAKFGLWLHWGPQTVPAKGGGWYSRHLYSIEMAQKDGFGYETSAFHRQTYGHQSQFGYKDICNLWKAEKFDADATMQQFKKWGARYAAIIAQHCDNFDLYNTSIHQWNSLNVGPKRDILGEFAAAARRHGLPWMATSHAGGWSNKWYEGAFSADKEGTLKDVPYDGVLTVADGKGLWWEGLDPQQLYVYKYPDFEKELSQRLIELVENYRPDILYFDWERIPGPAIEACKRLYANSLKEHGVIQTIVTVKKPQAGTLLDFERGIADGLQDEYWQTDSSFTQQWYLKSDDQLRHNARSLKEMLIDIISKRGVLMFNLPVNADGSIPADQIAIMDEFGAWLNDNGEAIYATEPWKIYGAGGETVGGHFNERTADSAPWSDDVHRFTCSKDGKTIYIHIFGNPATKAIRIKELADKNLFTGKVKKVSLIGCSETLKWSMKSDALLVNMPPKMAFKDCNILKVSLNK